MERNERIETNPACPACGGDSLEYVERQKASCDVEVSFREGKADEVYAGSVNDTYDMEFMFVTCKGCNKVWGTQDEFLSDLNGGCSHNWRTWTGDITVDLKTGEAHEHVTCKLCGAQGVRVYQEMEVREA